MRRKDREMDEVFGWSVVDACTYATLGTVNADGTAYCTPLSLAREGRTLYFHCAHEGQKIDNLRQNTRVCVSCVGRMQIPQNRFTQDFESAILYGKPREVTDREEKIRALSCICRRFCPDYMHAFDSAVERSLERTAIWAIEIDEITAKRKWSAEE